MSLNSESQDLAVHRLLSSLSWGIANAIFTETPSLTCIAHFHHLPPRHLEGFVRTRLEDYTSASS